MRVMFAVSPGLDHLYPAVGLAWALRTAGHEVVVATSGASTQAAAQAGFAVRDVSPEADFGAIFPRVGSREERARAMRERGLAIARTLETPDVILEKFSRVSDLMADGTLRFAEAWRPDLIVYSRLQGAALLTARALGVPAVEHGFSFLREGAMPSRFLPYLAPVYERLGVPVELPPLTRIHFAPEHMMHGEGEGWTMRFVPFHGGGVLPDWLAEPKRRPRICVTLGTTVPHVAGVGSLESVLAAAGGVDAEFVLALGDDPELAPLGTLPENVRVVGWTPLGALLSGCDAIIHHGGAGTTLASAHAGVVQLALAHGADNWINAAMVERCGMGLSREPADVSTRFLEGLLADEALRKSAASVADELAAQPGPDQMVPRLLDLTRQSG
ncbi:nucleotide disphospho-sugar-binding domain-containing protein [Streptomyces sp. TP-A0874]|uniref:nucleotide disphospho-sugar-binding domain-containing protein n=1 Tax=Streptomyces sp. TP-A0874 TaxID=549819 RepID=UPI00085318C8|nr:nucleotide disphospho-sugar-binding domain-containing protein [Streptomyces sp. TP-A0874]